MNIIKIISEHKKRAGRMDDKKFTRTPAGYKRVMAIVQHGGQRVTRHFDIAI